MSGIGGYVRKKDRKPFYEPKYIEHPWGYHHFILPSGCVVSLPKEPPFFQSMPILKFEEFKAT